MERERYRALVRATRHFAATLLFLSGVTGLTYELCWSKRLANVLGNSGQAHAIVLAVFLGGLALGAFLGGSLADRRRRPLAFYGLLELGVAGWALLFPSVMAALEAVFLATAPHLGEAAKTTFHLALVAAALLPPTVLMGGTLPAMLRTVTNELGETQQALARLYAINSMGAAAGALTAGLLLVPAAGLLATERAAAGLNALLGLAALIRGLAVHPNARAPQAEQLEPLRLTRRDLRLALFGTAVAGLVSMVYQIVWIRLLSIVIGGTSYAFTLIVASFIIGVALGSSWLARLNDTNPLRTFGFLQLGLACSVALSLPLYQRLPYLFIQLQNVLQHGPQAFGVFQVTSLLFCSVVVLPPTFFLGASFPAAARVVLSDHQIVGQQLGTVSLFNTVGTVLGSLATGLALLPYLGLESCLRLGLALTILNAVLVLGAGVSTTWRQRALLAAVVGIAVVAGLGPRGWAEKVVSAGRWREWKQGFENYQSFQAAVAGRATVEFFTDDVFASVMVGAEDDQHRFLRINGKVDGSNGNDADTQALAAHLGVLLHSREVKRVLLVGLGTGITAGALLAHPIETLDVVEILPAVVEAARHFANDNGRALDDPRCHLHLDDARSFLALAHTPYDLIISIPSNPWVTGVAGLFTTDFFTLAKSKLTPDGRLIQWIHTYETNRSMVELVVRTIRHTFAHGTTWVGPDDFVLVVSTQSQPIDGNVLSTRMKAPPVASALAAIKVHFAETLLARQVHSDEGQLRLAGAGPLNTDDHNRLEYGAPLGYFVGSHVLFDDERVGPGQGETLALAPWLEQHPLDAQRAEDIVRNLQWVHAPNEAVLRGAAEAWHRAAPASEAAALVLAQIALAQSDVPAAKAALAPHLAPDASARLWAQWLAVRLAEFRRETGPWNIVDVSADIVHARALLAASIPGPDTEALRLALASLEAAQ